MIYLPAEFPLDPDICYLNHAAIGPWPRRTAQTVANLAHQIMSRGGSDYPTWLETERRLRERLARLINAGDSDDIALLKNTSEGLSIISQGIDWQAGDEVVGIKGDFCSNQIVWEVLAEHGVRYMAVDTSSAADEEGALIDEITPRTRLMAVSTVHFATGYRYDLQRLSQACRQRDVLLSVDAIQSLGACSFDLEKVPADFVAAGGHKWLLSAEGLGFLYCRPALRSQLRLHQYGWALRESPYAFEDESWTLTDSARRFESGTPNMLGIHAMDATLSLFEEVGMEEVERRLSENVTYLISALRELPDVELVTPAEPANQAGIVTFLVRGIDGSALHKNLMERGVICSPRAGGVRLSPHFYTPASVLERTIEHIRQSIQILNNHT